MDLETAIRNLVGEADRYLARFDQDGIAETRAGIAGVAGGPIRNSIMPSESSCGHLDAALSYIAGADSLGAAIANARPYLNWATYDAYPREMIGERFPVAHSVAGIIGGSGFIPANDFELGLFLIAPKTLYRDHRHPAPELYAPLTGPHEWRFGVDDVFTKRPAHKPIWNAPMRVHSTLVRDVPFLALFAWTRDVALPSKVVPALDWPEIEASL